ncbi:MAG: hypothetical protein ABFD94_06095 [Armatimonadia bacterium]
MHITFTEAVARLQQADFVIVALADGDRTVANALGYSEEGDDSSDFFVCPGNTYDDILLKQGENIELNGDGTALMAWCSVQLFPVVKAKFAPPVPAASEKPLSAASLSQDANRCAHLDIYQNGMKNARELVRLHLKNVWHKDVSELAAEQIVNEMRAFKAEIVRRAAAAPVAKPTVAAPRVDEAHGENVDRVVEGCELCKIDMARFSEICETELLVRMAKALQAHHAASGTTEAEMRDELLFGCGYLQATSNLTGETWATQLKRAAKEIQ